MGKKQQKYVMTYKMKDGSTAPSGGVVKTDSKGKPVKRDDRRKAVNDMGKPSKGTKADKRLTQNKPAPAKKPAPTQSPAKGMNGKGGKC